MKRILLLAFLLSGVLAVSFSARASSVAPLGDVACGVYTNAAAAGIPCVTNEWLDQTVGLGWGSCAPSWWADYGVTVPGATPAPSAAATTGQLKWCVRQAAALLDNVATNVGGAGPWLSWTASNLPLSDNDSAVTVAEFAALVEPVVDRVQDLEIDSTFTPAEWSSIGALFDCGSHSNEPVSLAHLKDVFSFDPEIDSFADGIPDWWQRCHGLISWGECGEGDPDADFDLDGLADRGEWLAGSDPTDRDTDGDGLVDGIDPDPLVWTDPTDANTNGVPDAFELHWFGALAPSLDPAARDATGFTLEAKMAAGLCPTNAPFAADVPTNGIEAVRLVPRFGAESAAGAVLWEKTFPIARHGAWEQYFVSSDPNPARDRPADRGGWTLDGLRLDWLDSTGASGSAAASPVGAPLHLAVSTNAPAWIRLRLVAARETFATCPQPLHFLTYVPEFSLPELSSAEQGMTRLSASTTGEDVDFAIDRSTRPTSGAFLPGEADALPFELPVDAALDWHSQSGTGLSTGTLLFERPGLFSIPQIASAAAVPLRGGLRAPPVSREFLLAVLDPFLTYGLPHYWGGSRGIGWDWQSRSSVRTSTYPLDTAWLWRSFRCDATGRFICDCEPALSLGGEDADAYREWFDIDIAVTGDTAEATVGLGGETLWTGTATHEWQDWYWEDEPLENDCGCGGADALEGPTHASLGFRIPLGIPREGQVSGFLWFHTDGPLALSAETFQLLTRADATVSDTAAGGVRTVACSDARGRTLALSSVAGGVRIVVTDTATGALQHTWDVVNENGSASRIRLTKANHRGETLSDAVFVHDGTDWHRIDPVANTLATLRTENRLDDPGEPRLVEERVLADAADTNRVYAHTLSVSHRFGDLLRETERVEDIGTPFEKASFATYWGNGGRRTGLPRLVGGDARAWSWTDYDALGRPTLRFDQRDGSANPGDSESYSLQSPPWGAFATVSDYVPLAGDSNDTNDLAAVRTQSRYVVDNGVPVLIARTWNVYVRTTTNGLPSVSVRTERAASQAAAFGDPSNAVSVAVSVDPDAEGVPLLLRGRPISYTGEDGVTTTYDYDYGSWDEAAKVFTASSGASHLRTRIFTATPEAPSGVPLVSTVSETVEDAVHGNGVWSATRVLRADGSLSDPFDWEARTYDDKDRLRSTLYPDGSSATNAYSCCRLLFTVDRNGMKRERLADTGTDHLRHAWLDRSFANLPKNTNPDSDSAVPASYSYERSIDFRAVASTFDPLGRETVRRTMATRPHLAERIGELRPAPGSATASYWWESVETNAYPQGSSDFLVRVDARGLRTETTVLRDESADETWTESFDGTNLLERIVTLSVRGGETESFRAWDSGWTDALSFSRYGADGRRADYSVSCASDSPVVTNSVVFSDFLGRTARVVTPLADTRYVYDGASSRVRSVRDSVSGLSTETVYDALREPVGSVSAGVASLSTTRYERDGGAWWRVVETREAAAGETNLLSTVRERLTGLSDALRSETVSEPAGGPVSTTTVSFDPDTLVSVETNLVDGLAPLVVRSKFGRTIETEERDGTVRRFYFDAYGRPYLTGETPPGDSFVWRTWTVRDALGDVADEIELTLANLAAIGLAQDHASAIVTHPNNDNNQTKWKGLMTQHVHDVRGNRIAFWDQEGIGTGYLRDSVGRLVMTYGPGALPSFRGLDTAGRLVSLETTRDGTVWDATCWDYDPATGLCTNKTYADGSSVSHTFAPDGLPLRTTLASGAWTQNAYDANRRLASVSTSDGEGDAAYAYDAFGRVSEVCGDYPSYAYSRDACGRVTAEAAADDFDNDRSLLARSFDGFGRPGGFSLDFQDDFAHAVCYDWGMDGNLAGMTLSNAQGRAVDVSFSWEQGRFAGCEVLDGNGDTAFFRTVARARRRPRLVTSCESGGVFGDTRAFDYAYDAIGRPVERGFDSFGYDARGQVTNAVLDGDAFRYAYDLAGNRTSANEAGAGTSYSANEVNQYTAAGAVEPEYDEDGNLADDGARAFDWSAAGHLVRVEIGNVRYDCRYDHLGRRTIRAEYRRSGNFWRWTEDREYVYDGWNLVYERRIPRNDDELGISYFWGPDLSGTLQGAGGVGGLVAVSVDGDYYFPGYDNNGNVIGYWNEDGEIVAEYAYDAFGYTIYEDGNMADFFPHRFSTKYYDAETDLYYYGYRYYSPSLGRWISRDPIGEQGGDNLFMMSGNNCLSEFDILGERQGEWPVSTAKDGWAFAGNMNFPGPGWSGTFRTRPTTNFDLAAKIHDLHYALNGLSFTAKKNIVGHVNPQRFHGSKSGKSAELSRKAKADYIFKMMNKLNWEGGRWSGTLNYLSRRVFYDDPKYFCKGDDFANFLLQPESWQLDDPDYLLMIPYSHLADPPRKTIVETDYGSGSSHGPGGPRFRKRIVSDYDATAPEDRNPGFMMWARRALNGVLDRVITITEQTDSSFVW